MSTCPSNYLTIHEVFWFVFGNTSKKTYCISKTQDFTFSLIHSVSPKPFSRMHITRCQFMAEKKQQGQIGLQLKWVWLLIFFLTVQTNSARLVTLANTTSHNCRRIKWHVAVRRLMTEAEFPLWSLSPPSTSYVLCFWSPVELYIRWQCQKYPAVKLMLDTCSNSRLISVSTGTLPRGWYGNEITLVCFHLMFRVWSESQAHLHKRATTGADST